MRWRRRRWGGGEGRASRKRMRDKEEGASRRKAKRSRGWRHQGKEKGWRRRKMRLVGRSGKGKGKGNNEVRTDVVPFMFTLQYQAPSVPKLYTTPNPKRTILPETEHAFA